MNLAAYLRVSTDRQADDGLGLEVQHDAVARWAQAHGHRIVATYHDAASGALEDRYGLGLALDDLRHTKADGLVIYRLDRLARELIIQEQLIAEVGRLGRRVYSTVAEEDALLDDASGDPSRKMVRQIIGAVAEFERAMIRLRTTAGRRKKKANGGYAGGAIPYGKHAVGGELVDSPAELAQLDIIRAMREGGASLREIAAVLEGSGVPAPKGGKTWHANTVRRLVGTSAE